MRGRMGGEGEAGGEGVHLFPSKKTLYNSKNPINSKEDESGNMVVSYYVVIYHITFHG